MNHKLLACVAFIGVATAATAAPVCEKVVNVGSWNIQWLGNAKAGRREPQKAQDLIDYISASKVDVLGLAEISVTSMSGTEGRNSSLDAAFQIANAAGSKWRYSLFPKREGARDPQDQWTGIAWNEDVVSKVGGPWALDVKVDAVREDKIRKQFSTPEDSTIVLSRWPYATKFSAEKGLTDFLVVTVHLKSNIGGAATALARGYEAELILQGLSRLNAQQRDPDLVILGDSNMLRAGEEAAGKLTGAELKDCNGRDLGTHISGAPGDKGAPFDRIFVMAKQPETAGTCPSTGDGSQPMDFKIVRPSDWVSGMSDADFRKRLSDHLLVRTAICVMSDDD